MVVGGGGGVGGEGVKENTPAACKRGGHRVYYASKRLGGWRQGGGGRGGQPGKGGRPAKKSPGTHLDCICFGSTADHATPPAVTNSSLFESLREQARKVRKSSKGQRKSVSKVRDKVSPLAGKEVSK